MIDVTETDNDIISAPITSIQADATVIKATPDQVAPAQDLKRVGDRSWEYDTMLSVFQRIATIQLNFTTITRGQVLWSAKVWSDILSQFGQVSAHLLDVGMYMRPSLELTFIPQAPISNTGMILAYARPSTTTTASQDLTTVSTCPMSAYLQPARNQPMKMLIPYNWYKNMLPIHDSGGNFPVVAEVGLLAASDFSAATDATMGDLTIQARFVNMDMRYLRETPGALPPMSTIYEAHSGEITTTCAGPQRVYPLLDKHYPQPVLHKRFNACIATNFANATTTVNGNTITYRHSTIDIQSDVMEGSPAVRNLTRPFAFYNGGMVLHLSYIKHTGVFAVSPEDVMVAVAYDDSRGPVDLEDLFRTVVLGANEFVTSYLPKAQTHMTLAPYLRIKLPRVGWYKYNTMLPGAEAAAAMSQKVTVFILSSNDQPTVQTGGLMLTANIAIGDEFEPHGFYLCPPMKFNPPALRREVDGKPTRPTRYEAHGGQVSKTGGGMSIYAAEGATVTVQDENKNVASQVVTASTSVEGHARDHPAVTSDVIAVRQQGAPDFANVEGGRFAQNLMVHAQGSQPQPDEDIQVPGEKTMVVWLERPALTDTVFQLTTSDAPDTIIGGFFVGIGWEFWAYDPTTGTSSMRYTPTVSQTTTHPTMAWYVARRFGGWRANVRIGLQVIVPPTSRVTISLCYIPGKVGGTYTSADLRNAYRRPIVVTDGLEAESTNTTGGDSSGIRWIDLPFPVVSEMLNVYNPYDSTQNKQDCFSGTCIIVVDNALTGNTAFADNGYINVIQTFHDASFAEPLGPLLYHTAPIV